eukprot:5600362-Prymnesium_polylepis.1
MRRRTDQLDRGLGLLGHAPPLRREGAPRPRRTATLTSVKDLWSVLLQQRNLQSPIAGAHNHEHL